MHTHIQCAIRDIDAIVMSVTGASKDYRVVLGSPISSVGVPVSPLKLPSSPE